MKKSLLVVATVLALTSCTKTEKTISGSVTLLPDLQKSLGPNATLYIIARNEGQTTGMPIAVKRFTQPLNFPLEFNLTPQDAMIANTPFEGKMMVTARIAQSGAATPVQAGDIEGSAQPNPVPVGEKSLKITLNHVH